MFLLLCDFIVKNHVNVSCTTFPLSKLKNLNLNFLFKNILQIESVSEF